MLFAYDHMQNNIPTECATLMLPDALTPCNLCYVTLTSEKGSDQERFDYLDGESLINLQSLHG